VARRKGARCGRARPPASCDEGPQCGQAR
jgi:hypothetical protein